MRNEGYVIYCKLEYVTMDTDGNIVLALKKKTRKKETVSILKLIEGSEVNITIKEHIGDDVGNKKMYSM